MDITHQSSTEHPVVRHVMPSYTLRWLRLGWRDIKKSPVDALFYGAAFVLMGYFLSYYFSEAPQIVITLSALFLLAGPFLAIGLYDLARQMEAFDGQGRASLLHSMVAWRGNIQAFSLYAVLLAVVVFAWFRVSLLMFALFYDTAALPSIDDILRNALLPENLPFMLVYFGTGFFFAALVYGCSVIAMPMMLDKEVDTITAMVNSLQAVYKNVLTMLLWAVIIVGLTAVGFATMYLGLILTVPLVGFASWHAYRDLVSYQ
ncbi:DUF2189 domain-containing protein [Paludibacterium paludis]|uniref:Cytochrome b6 n=1 Tax=Paludibacterium paludis TaxID=1225769 RepID=A0A918U8M3_9NEIS|nr:DUF2189 domain-containing protein [Paludibacterium paludis]GGY07969.1 cytochrome b6 [Paludibacterium paludis]